MSTTHLRPLSFGETLDGAFVLYRRNFVPLVLTALIPLAPLAILNGYVVSRLATLGPEAGGAEPAAVLLPSVAVGVLTVGVWAALTRQASRAVTGDPLSLGDAYASAARAFLPLLGVGILAVAAGFVLAVALSLVLGVVGMILSGVVGAAAAVVGGILSIAGALALMLGLLAALFAVTAAVVVEGKRSIGAMQRSWSLARGAWGRIIGVTLVSYLIVFLPTLALVAATGFGTAAFSADPGALPQGLVFLQQVLALLLSSLTLPFFALCLTLLYYDRRVRTEALDLEMDLAPERLAPTS